MNNAAVRICRIEIRNFKNVGYGCLDLSKCAYQSNILGLYGQNGSGKTTLIDALELLRLALCGRTVPASFADFVNVDSECATLSYGLSVRNLREKSTYNVTYSFSVRRDLALPDQNAEGEAMYKVTLFDEVLSCAYQGEDAQTRLARIIDTRPKGSVFVPDNRFKELMGKGRETKMNLQVAKQLANESSRSFVFSRELLNVLHQNCTSERYRFLMESLVFFGNYELFVITAKNAGWISLDALPVPFNYAEGRQTMIGKFVLKLDEASLIPENDLSIVNKVIDSMNVVLQQLVPGLTIGEKVLGTQLLKDGSTARRIALMSKKNSKEIPLRYESDGIKKLISVLQLLIVVYNNPSITVAVDELDSGIFEYLLGEILRIISEKGKGQLIFTSHNLRPLETLDKSCIAFTTTNPANRYIRMNNVKATNNLRDFYYRDIILGEQSELLYEPTGNSEIALAFKEAGVHSGT